MFETLVLGQIVRHFANRGDRPTVHFFRDYAGNEVDFVVPTGARLRLVECKWAETPSTRLRGFAALDKLVGERRIASRTVVTPERVSRTVGGIGIEGCVDLAFLDGDAA